MEAGTSSTLRETRKNRARQLPWSWIIEYLASFSQIPVSILRELVAAAPKLRNEHGGDVWEALSLRCLEEVFEWKSTSSAAGGKPTNDGVPFPFDQSPSCLDIIKFLFPKGIPISKWENTESLKWDIGPFLRTKRAALPQCTLQQLRHGATSATSLQPVSPLLETVCATNVVSSAEPLQAVDGNSNSEQNVTRNKVMKDYLENENSEIAMRNRACLENEVNKLSTKDSGRICRDADLVDINGVHLGGVLHRNSLENDLIEIDNYHSDDELTRHSDLNDHLSTHASSKKLFLDARSDEAEDNIEVQSSEDTFNESDKCHPESVDVTKEKERFLNSQSTLSDDNLCMACHHHDNDLVACNAYGCPIQLHERCSGSSCNDENFYCPFCAYSMAISRHLRAKQGVSLAREKLRNFICGEPLPKSHEKVISDRGENSRSNQGGLQSENAHENVNLSHVHDVEREACEGNKKQVVIIESGSDGPLCGRGEPKSAATMHNSSDGEKEVEGVISKKICVEGMIGQDLEREACEGNKKQVVIIESGADGPLCGRGEPKSAATTQNSSDGEKEVECVISKRNSVEGMIGQDDRPHSYSHSHSYLNHDSSNGKNKVNKNVSNEALDQTTTMPSNNIPVCRNDVDNDPSLLRRLRERAQTLKSPSSPQLKRKRIPWSVEEEELLKEGVKKFSTDGENIPWKKIQDYGRSVFGNVRTPIDLKDKWRNICKINSKQH